MSDEEFPLEVEEFLVWLSAERGRARNTVQAYRRDLLRSHGWLRTKSLTPLTVTYTDLTDFVAERCQAYWPVVESHALVSFLEYRCYVRQLPVLGHFTQLN